MSDATLDNLLQQMKQDGEVLQGWDAVMNLLESAVNQFFQVQWNQQTGNSGKMSIQTVWCNDVQHLNDQYFTNVTQLVLDFGAPLFQFANGQDSVTVTQKILDGSLKTGTMVVPSNFQPPSCGCQIDDTRVTWSPPVSIDTSKGPTLSGTVQLEQVLGLVTSATSLVLEFAKGSFTLNHLTVKNVENSAIVDQLKDWFVSHKVRYILASVDYSDVTGQAALTPTSFQLNVVTTGSGNTVVQILITTNGSQPATNQINVEEPIPTADGFTCSLMVSSRILYNYILVQGFNQPGATYSLVALPPPSEGASWYAAISPELHFEGEFSFGSCCDRTTVTYSIYLGGNYTGSTTDGFTLYQSETTRGNVHLDISVYAANPVALSGSGAKQELTIRPGTPSVSVTGSAESQIKSRLEDILNTDLCNSMAGISFAPITYFALKSLLFPDNLIQMSQAQVPSDLLIVGTFEPA